LVDKTISNPHDILPALELSRQASRPLLIVSHGLEGDARNAVVMNTVQGMLKVCSVKAPRIGEKRSQILENLAILTGGNVLSDVTGVNLKDVAADQVVGGADNIKVTSETTTIFEGHGQDDEIEDRIKMMRGRLAQAHSEHDKEFYQQQASHMSGGIAVIRVGAASELEMKEYKARVEDALSATQSAVQSGIVPGGGTTLLAIAAHLDDLMKNYPDETGCEGEEERYGYSLLAKSLREPFMHIMRNAGRDPSECYFLFKQASEKTPALVMDARTGEIKDALEAGIIDPSRVIEQVLINSVSVAGTAITTACMITSSKTADCFDDDTKHV
jgi:chaperonin GroEL